jgi:hypothetical protein
VGFVCEGALVIAAVAAREGVESWKGESRDCC